MYAWMFRRLPGPLWVRIVSVVLVLAVLVVVLFGWVFPAIAPLVPLNDGVVEGSAAADRPTSGSGAVGRDQAPTGELDR